MSVRALVREFLPLPTDYIDWAETGMDSVQTLALTVDALYSCIIGLLLYFAPQFVGDYVFQRETDGVHWHLIRCFGAQILAIAYMNFRLRESADSSKSACYFVRIVSAVVTMMLIVQCWVLTPTLIYEWKLAFSFVFQLALFCFYFVCMMWNGWPVDSHAKHEQGLSNLLFQLESMIYICVGIIWLAFPNMLLNGQVIGSLDGSHELIGRLMGAFFLATYANGLHALHWKSIKDRAAVINARVIGCVGISAAQVWSQVAYLDDWTLSHWIGISLFSLCTTFAFMQYLIHPSEEEDEIYSKKQD